LVYYEVTEAVFDDLAKTELPVWLGPWVAERTLQVLGLAGRLRYCLKPWGLWHHYDVAKRQVELAGPTCTVLEVLHEVAHAFEPRHNGLHLMSLQLLAEAWAEL